MRRLAVLGAVTVLALGALTGCGEENRDAPRGVENTGPADVVLFPDGFSNVAHKCDGPNMVYSATNGAGSDNAKSTRAAITVIANDPRCK